MNTAGRQLVLSPIDVLGIYQITRVDDNNTIVGAFREKDPFEVEYLCAIYLYLPVIGMVALALERDLRKWKKNNPFVRMEYPDICKYLSLIVLIHEFGHFYTHRGQDAFKGTWPTQDFIRETPFVKESLAQYLTLLACLEGFSDLWLTQGVKITFEMLLQGQPKTYTEFLNQYDFLPKSSVHTIIVARRGMGNLQPFSESIVFLGLNTKLPASRNESVTEELGLIMSREALLRKEDSSTPDSRNVLITAPEPLAIKEWNPITLRFPLEFVNEMWQEVRRAADENLIREEQTVLTMREGILEVRVTSEACVIAYDVNGLNAGENQFYIPLKSALFE